MQRRTTLFIHCTSYSQVFILCLQTWGKGKRGLCLHTVSSTKILKGFMVLWMELKCFGEDSNNSLFLSLLIKMFNLENLRRVYKNSSFSKTLQSMEIKHAIADLMSNLRNAVWRLREKGKKRRGKKG